MTSPEVARCPRCGSSERVEVIDPPAHDPDARYLCRTCNLNFTGSAKEAHDLAVRDAVKAAERGDMMRRAEVGRAAGVIGQEHQP